MLVCEKCVNYVTIHGFVLLIRDRKETREVRRLCSASFEAHSIAYVDDNDSKANAVQSVCVLR